jgi:hypothetical protein
MRLRRNVLLISLIVMFCPALAFAAVGYGTTSTNQLVRFDTSTGSSSAVAITGMQAGEVVFGLDYRPETRQLYAIGSTSRVYVIDPATGNATTVGCAPFAAAIGSGAGGMDINPVVDRIRIVTSTNQNMRVNPQTGALTAVDTSLSYALGDPHAGATPAIAGSAYSDNLPFATTTTLYAVDSALDLLAIQNPPNAGTLNTIGTLGVDVSSNSGFDIAPDGTAYLLRTLVSGSSLYKVNLATGAASIVASNVAGSTELMTLAMPPQPVGDVDGDGAVTPVDAFYLINYLFAGGAAPVQ